MQGVVIEMRVGGDADIDLGQRKIVKIPIPGARWQIAPGVEHDRDAGRRRHPERR